MLYYVISCYTTQIVASVFISFPGFRITIDRDRCKHTAYTAVAIRKFSSLSASATRARSL